MYQEVNSPPALSIGYISGWITNSANLGDINNKLDASFCLTGDQPCIAGGFGKEESNIYTLMFKSDYYESQSLAALTSNPTFWTSMQEGDTRLAREGTAAISKAYLALNQQSNQFLRLAIHDYKLRLTVPQTVDANSLYSFPSP